MIAEDAFARIKDGAIIINTAREPMIKEAALIDTLKSGKVAAAGLDTFEEGAFKDVDNELCKMDNVLFSSHVAYNTAESFAELCETVGNIVAIVLGGEILLLQ
ncbi:MAG: hypothetical protein FH753_12465 [Firmicutes bacterium]|nr:hypothetical protein [Bacillota bacterium]